MADYYGTAVPTPTGHGLPGFEDGTYSAQRPLRDIVWCEAAGCPKDQCVACQKAAR